MPACSPAPTSHRKRRTGWAAIWPASQIVEQRPGAGLTGGTAYFGGLAANLFFDAVESADAGDGLGGDGRSVHRVDVMKLAPGMGPAGDFIDAAATVEVMKSSVGIGLQRTLEVLQMHLGMLSLAIGRVGKPHGWRGAFTNRPLIANVGPEASGPGLAVAGSEHRNR